MTEAHRRTVAAVIVAVAVGWWATHSDNSPLAPKKPDRPVIKFLSRIARLGLWVALAAEKPPEPEQRQTVAKFDENGNRILNHEEGW